MRYGSVTHSPESPFGALADPTRRAVLDMLRSGSQPAGQIAQAFLISRPAVSKHLRVLLRARLVRERREGRRRIYELNPAPLRAVDSWIRQYQIFWEASLTGLKTIAETKHARKGAQRRVKKEKHTLLRRYPK
jgi:DNA-binding transcriptional ArsR family regulator